MPSQGRNQEPPSPIRGIPVRAIRLSRDLELRIAAQRRGGRLVVDARLFRRGLIEHLPTDYVGTAAGWVLAPHEAGQAAQAIAEVAKRLAEVDLMAAGHDGGE